MRGPALLILGVLLASPRPSAPLHADEGMWTFDNFPRDRVQKKYGFGPDEAWLSHVRLSSVRLAGGCSGSFVSESGLVMTNHHCALDCIKEHSTARRDLIQAGFVARTAAEERKCSNVELNQLVGIEDVTARIQGALKGLSDKPYNDALKAEMSRIEKDCAQGERLRCDVVELYHGGRFHLYRYRRYQDVRLVFAPESQMAYFGGDPDNFMFPRYDLDVSFLRAYESGSPAQAAQPAQPAKIDHYLKWSPAGVKEGDLVFVSGHPGGTQRLLTVAELEFLRDVTLPNKLRRLAELRGMLVEFGKRGPEERRIAREHLWEVENSLKGLGAEHEALLDRALFSRKIAEEQALRERVGRDPELKKRYGGAWEAVARSQADLRRIWKPLGMIEEGTAFASPLFEFARTLVRAAAERPRPNEARLREYRESALPSLTQELFSQEPLYPALEELTLAFSLGKMRELLGADSPLTRKVLGQESPESLAHALISRTRLMDVALRRRLWEGGSQAIAASSDPLIRLALLIDGDARALRQKYEDEIEAVQKKNSELIAKALFATQGTSVYPDATFTLRLSYGEVKGYREDGRQVAPVTTFRGAFERATGKEPFALPRSWLLARDRLDLATPLDFASTCDIVGGNSGSPMINRDGEIVGLIFDGNIQSLGGAFWFDEAQNRAVSVHSTALLVALDKIYHAERLLKEIRPLRLSRN